MSIFRILTSRIRSQIISELIVKFKELHDYYYGQGDLEAANVVVDLVAWLQDDYEALEK